MNKILCSIIGISMFFLVIPSAVSQEEIPLSVHHKVYANGGSVVVGNTILGKHKTKSFDKEKVSNDAIDMVYVDVDSDLETFSSSSATVTFPEGTTRVLYAALYWSGLYPAEKSTMKLGKKSALYSQKGERQKGVDSIKIKLGDTPYIDIVGDLVYDAKAKGAFKNDSPYVCRATITDYINEAGLNSTNFTAANIRAIRGKLEGGSAAGWHLYIVYENPNDSPKYFTTFDGFRRVARHPVEITFNDFKTKSLGEIESTLVMATLEGDVKIKSDECAIYNVAEDSYINLNDANRNGVNFFRSSITMYSEMFLDRNPASKNTLGFDLLKMKLAKGLISNNAEEAKIRFRTRADRFYVYFTAFETEIEEALMNEKNTEGISSVNLEEPTIITEQVEEEPPTIVVETVTEVVEEIEVEEIVEETVLEVVEEVETEEIIKETVVEVVYETEQISETEVKEVAEEVVTEVKEVTPEVSESSKTIQFHHKEYKRITIEGMTSGYFLVTNVFSQEALAKKWTAFLLEEGYNPQQFENPENGWMYVYVFRTNVLDEIIEKRMSLREKEYFKDIWIAGINR